MPFSTDQVPLAAALRVSPSSPGVYELSFPHSISYGSMINGGWLVSQAQAAVADHFSRNPKISNQLHTRTLAIQFFRPTFPQPETAIISIRDASIGKFWSTAHVEISQRGKVNLAGHLTLTNLAQAGRVTIDTHWSLSPPPPVVNLSQLESDASSDWHGYLTPYDPRSFRRCQSYIKYFCPSVQGDAAYHDQWITPGWLDASLPDGALWTNEMMGFVLDGSLPVLDNFMPPDLATGSHAGFLKASREQRAADPQGRSGQPGTVKTDRHPYTTPFTYVTLNMSAEIKKLLPGPGVKWLFVRARTRQIENDRTDMEVTVLDEEGVLVAVSHQVLQVVPTGAGKTRKEAKVREAKVPQAKI